MVLKHQNPLRLRPKQLKIVDARRLVKTLCTMIMREMEYSQFMLVRCGQTVEVSWKSKKIIARLHSGFV